MLKQVAVVLAAAMAAVGVEAKNVPRHQHFHYARQLGNTTTSTASTSAEQMVSLIVLVFPSSLHPYSLPPGYQYRLYHHSQHHRELRAHRV